MDAAFQYYVISSSGLLTHAGNYSGQLQSLNIEMVGHCTSPFACDFNGFCQSALPDEPEGGNQIPASLKAVLPAIVPDLSYSDPEIQEGGSASLTYESLYNEPDPESIAKKRDDLLKYCEMDTLSMVRILELL